MNQRQNGAARPTINPDRRQNGPAQDIVIDNGCFFPNFGLEGTCNRKNGPAGTQRRQYRATPQDQNGGIMINDGCGIGIPCDAGTRRNGPAGPNDQIRPPCQVNPPPTFPCDAEAAATQQCDYNFAENEPAGPSDHWDPPPTYAPLTFNGRRQTELATQYQNQGGNGPTDQWPPGYPNLQEQQRGSGTRGNRPDYQRTPSYPEPQDQYVACKPCMPCHPLCYPDRRQTESAPQNYSGNTGEEKAVPGYRNSQQPHGEDHQDQCLILIPKPIPTWTPPIDFIKP